MVNFLKNLTSIFTHSDKCLLLGSEDLNLRESIIRFNRLNWLQIDGCKFLKKLPKLPESIRQVDGQNLLNSTYFGKNSVASMRLKLFSKFDCFWKIEFVKLKFQPKIEFLKLDLRLILKKKEKRKKNVELKFHAFKKNNPNETQVLLFFLNGTRVY